MFHRGALIQRWTTRLADAEAQLARAAPRSLWWHHVSVRLYRFLLACYGAGDWRPEEDTESGDAGDRERPSTAELVDNVGVLDGKRPKNVAQMRQVLDEIHGANPPATAGPLTRAAYQDGWVAATAESAHVQPRRCVRWLREHGIKARAVRRGDDVIVEVHGGDLEQAVRLIEDARERLHTRNRSPIEVPVPARIAVFGLWFAGLVLLLAFHSSMPAELMMALFAGLTVLVCILLGLISHL
jgi:hypothetical protein